MIVGFDPGLMALGIGALEKEGPLYRVVKQKTFRTSPGVACALRLEAIQAEVVGHVNEGDLAVIEDQGGVWMGKAKRSLTNAKARLAGRVQDLIHGICLTRGARVVLVTPLQVRTVLGLPRNATKEQVWRFACLRLLQEKPARPSSHARDAAALAVVGAVLERTLLPPTVVVKAKQANDVVLAAQTRGR